MRFPTAPRFAAIFALTTTAITLLAQPAPPAQNYVAAIGSTPFKAPATADFAPGASFTMEGWFYLTGTTPYGWLMGKGLATAGVDPYLSFGLLMNEDGTRVRFSVSTGAAGSARDANAPTAFPLRTWTHVAAVMDGSTMRLLINGAVVATGSAPGAPLSESSVALGVGVAYQGNGNTNFPSFPGFARQVRFWNVARTAAQISADASAALPADRTGLVAAWPLDESSGNSARDLSGNNRALTGGGNWLRTTVLDAGPFFAVTSTTPAGNVLDSADDGILIDFDNDGDLDLVTFHITVPPTVPETRRRLRAFRNTNGAFTDVTDAVLGNVTMVHPRDRYVGDFNNDGRADLIVVGHGTDTPPFPGEQAKIFIQSADGRLVDETATRLPQRSDFTHNLAVGDIDGDGDLDLYLANINGAPTTTGGPRFYINNGSGVFTEATDRLPADIANRTNGVVYTSARLLDLTGDGRADLVLGGSDSAPTNEILINDGTGRFVRDSRYVLPPKLFNEKASTVAITVADLNADGAPDLLLSTTGGTILMPDGRTIDGYGLPGVQLLLNRGDGTFYDATAQLNLTFGAKDTWVEWMRVADLNGDGRPDIVLQGAPHSDGSAFSKTILLNRGGAVFVDASEAVALPAVTFLQPGDVNRDGLPDLVGITSNEIVVARALKKLDRAVFQTTPDDPARLVNLSVLTSLASRTDSFTVGYVASGASATNSKPLVIRAAGPALGALGFPGTIDDPKLELFAGPTKTNENDDWGGSATVTSAMAAVGGFPYASATSRDAAFVGNVTSSDNSVRVTAGANSATGAGAVIAEVYDATTTRTASTPRLVNFSVAKTIAPGGSLTLGFVVGGNTPKTMLIRVIGPGLAAVGLTSGTLGDPQLTLYNGASEKIAVNNDWGATSRLIAASAKVNAFSIGGTPTKDSVLLIELPPGSYTATATGNANSSGFAIVEAYDVPES